MVERARYKATDHTVSEDRAICDGDTNSRVDRGARGKYK